VYPRRSEKEEPHSTLNAKPPSVTSASIESTRHLTCTFLEEARECHAEQYRVRAVNATVPAIHLPSAIVHDTDRAVGWFEGFGEIELSPRRENASPCSRRAARSAEA